MLSGQFLRRDRGLAFALPSPSARRNRNRERPWSVLALLALVVLACTAVARAAAPEPGPWVGLAEGKLGKYRWMVRVQRPGGRAGAGRSAAQRPCLMVGTSWRQGRFNYRRSKYRQCAGNPGRLSSTEPPLIASAAQPGTGPAPALTAIGMVFAPAARRVEITLRDGEQMTVRLHRLNSAQARRAGLVRFRYAAFVVRGTWCAERVVSKDAAGRMLWDSGIDEYLCGSGS